MSPALTYDELIDGLSQRFKYKDAPDRHVRMSGIVFARPNSPFAKAEIIPQIPDWHYRSGEHIDFFYGGYTYPFGGGEPPPRYVNVPISGHRDWLYSAELFNEFRQDIQQRTTWTYSGATDLLLANARYDSVSGRARLDFKTTVVCQLESLKESKAIAGVERFFEDIFRFAESAPSDDPTWGFSDQQGISTTGSAIKRLVLAVLPKDIGTDINRISQFAVRDVSLVS